MARSHRMIVDAAHDSLRLDSLLASSGLVSRRKARELLSSGSVYLNRKRIKIASRVVHAGDVAEFYIIETRTEDFPAQVPLLHSDSSVVVVNKPPGMPVQGTRESDRGTLLEAVAKQLRIDQQQLKVVHRLDQTTSGVMLLARGRAAAADLSAQLSSHSAERQYLAAVEGNLLQDSVLRHLLSKPRRSSARAAFRVEVFPSDDPEKSGLRTAVTHVRKLGGTSEHSLLHLRLETGLTHQIRAQLAFMGSPLVADLRYGARKAAADSPLQRTALHAATLSFRRPGAGDQLTFFAPLPEDFRRWLEQNALWLPELEPTSNQAIPTIIRRNNRG